MPVFSAPLPIPLQFDILYLDYWFSSIDHLFLITIWRMAWAIQLWVDTAPIKQHKGRACCPQVDRKFTPF